MGGSDGVKTNFDLKKLHGERKKKRKQKAEQKILDKRERLI